jgi:hypothetical protein
MNTLTITLMKIIFKALIQFWYLWALIIVLEILKLFMPKIKGYFGEKSVALFLSRLNKNKYKVINNIMLQVENKTTQIDHIVISNYGIFVIETKNYKSLIIGNEFDDNWEQVFFKHKEIFHNPIRQNYGHIQALKQILIEYSDINYISIVTFTTKADLKVNSNTDVVYTINLLKTIKKHNEETLTDPVKEKIFNKLVSLNIDSKENRNAHVKEIHKNITEKNNTINSGICPRCGGTLVLRNGKYGKFKGCQNYPNCRFIEK